LQLKRYTKITVEITFLSLKEKRKEACEITIPPNKILENPLVVERLAASRGGFSFMQLIT
jgi:hypothetical protein